MYEELVKALHEHAKPDGWDCSVCMCRNAEDRGFYTCTEELAAKAADAIEELRDRNVGKWLFWQDDPDANVYECSACHEPLTLNEGTPRENNFNFCPFCGLPMKEGDDDV